MNKIILILLISLSPIGIVYAQTCLTGTAVQSTPTSAFTVNNDGTVFHKKTGLIWKVCSEGQTWVDSPDRCDDATSLFNWSAGLVHAQAASFAGHSDWRLPNHKELRSIVELQCENPAINEVIFMSTSPDYHWTSSPYTNKNGVVPGNLQYSRMIHFISGNDHRSARTDSYRIRLVRGGG